MDAATLLKLEGGVHFRKAEYAEARELYSSARRLVRGAARSVQWESLEVALCSNLAACYQKLGQFDQVLSVCASCAASASRRVDIGLRRKLALRQGLAFEGLGREREALRTVCLAIRSLGDTGSHCVLEVFRAVLKRLHEAVHGPHRGVAYSLVGAVDNTTNLDPRPWLQGAAYVQVGDNLIYWGGRPQRFSDQDPVHRERMTRLRTGRMKQYSDEWQVVVFLQCALVRISYPPCCAAA